MNLDMSLHDEVKESLRSIVQKAKNDEDILAVVLFGSYARKETFRDVDVALVIWPERFNQADVLHWEMQYSERDLDVSIYQQLPLYVQLDVLRDGVPQLVKDDDAFYDIAFGTLREWNDFRARYYLYLEAVLSEGKDLG